ncbi:MurR/RpiR family transcriptional regulator [Clostridium sp. 2-1]|uniref:DNA-binding MurR/RpiR family transcriptional regulator n=1 Tax=Clostridium beijerinckii TaxID=1520 RepID=A0AAX0BB58_CLOBE|nr:MULTISPECIES: MurR/RpiR family transcriptional regulator [Clostridium]MBN7576256.1 MurR/RpiR family transcriptional regulator [Clostridium beijerinckii]MBN7581288.1 MurR/RpiR family transcriptional regulator [Clostridium beijerinckii]MBN7586025.1 MurR/RpiR family transcriptional regulator [Clostridium beijerinckii]MBO0521908.1 MurR/RpiR family transcriptional regulator [Clostridium beijerinckii]NRT32122.1 DNA-binding MurR/RpiR family transcriptional regulator [Clostridium beijerinckii]
MKVDLSKIVNNKKITPIEEQVLEYIINNIDSVMDLGVRGLAAENYTSTSTIMRLSKKLGFTGFIDMIYNITPLIDGGSKGIIEESEALIGTDIKFLSKYIDEENVKKFIEILASGTKKYIFIYARGYSEITGEYFNKKLLGVGIKSILIDSKGSFENNLEDMETLIVISKSGETKEVLDKVQVAKKKNKVVISFTKEVENSISALSDISFKIFDMHKLDDSNVLANSFFANMLMFMEYLIYRYYQETRKENK